MGPYDVSAELTILVALAALALVMRWVFSAPRRRRAIPPDAGDSAELGLLDVVRSGLSRTEALRCRAVLGADEIRSSMSRRRDGTMDVLVFRTDLERARMALRR